MANWDDIINNRLAMGRSRQLCYAVNVERRRRENGEEERQPGLMPLLGRGIRPVVPRFQHWDGLQEENFYLNNMARGRSRPFPTPQPFLEIYHRRQPHSLRCCMAAGFGYVAPNAWFPLRLNSPTLRAPNPPQYVPPPPPPPQNQDPRTESSSSESSDAEEGNSLDANCSTP